MFSYLTSAKETIRYRRLQLNYIQQGHTLNACLLFLDLNTFYSLNMLNTMGVTGDRRSIY